MSEPTEQPERLKGVVKWFNSTKGFGFITVEDSEEEVFVHQSNIDTGGYRSLREGEDVEFELVVGDDGKKKAFHVTGPGGASPLGSEDLPRAGFSGRGGLQTFDPTFTAAAMYAYQQQAQQQQQQHQQVQQQHQQQQQQSPQLALGGGGGRGRGGLPPGGAPAPFYPPMPADPAYMAGYYQMGVAPPGAYGAYAAPYPRGRGGYFPGGRNWAGARPPPPGQPGFSSGLQVVVHNLPWDCTWQTLKDAFSPCGEIERADVVFDSRGRSRGFGIVRFSSRDEAETAAEKMNNANIGGRVVSVRIDRFA